MSIELTTSFYMVSNLWRSFFCSIVTVIFFKLFSMFTQAELFSKVVLKDVPVDSQYFLYIVLGVLCGIFGSLFISCFTRLVYLRTKMKMPFISNRWKLCFSVALITSLCTFNIPFIRPGDRTILNQMFKSTPLSENPMWNTPSVVFNLIVFCFLKFTLTVLGVSLPIPAGIFGP